MSGPFRACCTLLMTLSFFLLLGCSGKVVVEDSSPVQFGIGAQLAPTVADVGDATVHGLAGYQRQWFDGGHDDIVSVGVQGRRPLKLDAPDKTWLGVEAAYHYWRVSDESGFLTNPVSNVFGVSGLVGHPIGESGVHAWGSAGLLLFGDFKEDGEVAFEGGTGWMIQLGVELQRIPGRN